MDHSHQEEANYSRRQDSGEPQVRQRRVDVDGDDIDHSNEGVYKELERLRSLVDVIEGERNGSGGGGSGSRRGGGGIASCFPMTLDNSVMSTVFGLVFFTIVTVSVYAFHNLYRAIYKRFFEEIKPL